MNVEEFISEVSVEGYQWYLKRLSGNDTMANGSHQGGPHISRNFLFGLFPEWESRTDSNQDASIELSIDSHGLNRNIRAVWYNNKYRNGTRNEARLTNFGGIESPVLDPESTGALVVFAFRRQPDSLCVKCRMWITGTDEEENFIEMLAGAVEPGTGVAWSPTGSYYTLQHDQRRRSKCWLSESEILPEWYEKFPSGKVLQKLALEKITARGLSPDKRLIQRRVCEELAFYSIEEAIELKHVLKGFADIDSFMTKARSMMQRRMSRSGRSLELHAMHIFKEEGLESEVGFSWQAKTELGKKPDFVFPSIKAYNDESFSANRLRMLAVKTSCKDRWRQVINEADRIPVKHLLTLQEGVSVNQFKEMQDEGVQLVVPKTNKKKFNKDIQSKLLTFEEFIEEIKGL